MGRSGDGPAFLPTKGRTMTKIKKLGDVHLGKRWKNGVSLGRRGDREAMQWAEFEANLMDVEGVTHHVQVGDLFDEAIVPYGTIWRAAMAYLAAVEANPHCTYILYRGNHDASRDAEKVTAFRIFTAIVGEAVMIAADEPFMLVIGSEQHVFMPWHPVHTAGEMIVLHDELVRGADVIYGHWDVDARQAESTNYIPAATLEALGVKQAVTGHDHNKRDMIIDGLPVEVTGSMQPLDHSQDADERFYVTRDLAFVLANLDAFQDKHLRVRLQPGERLDVQVDCLQLTQIRDGQEEEAMALDVEFEAFDFDQLLGRAIEQVGLAPAVDAAMRDRLKEHRLHEDDQNVG
jgi:hypothetical protein